MQPDISTHLIRAELVPGLQQFNSTCVAQASHCHANGTPQPGTASCARFQQTLQFAKGDAMCMPCEQRHNDGFNLPVKRL